MRVHSFTRVIYVNKVKYYLSINVKSLFTIYNIIYIIHIYLYIYIYM